MSPPKRTCPSLKPLRYTASQETRTAYNNAVATVRDTLRDDPEGLSDAVVLPVGVLGRKLYCSIDPTQFADPDSPMNVEYITREATARFNIDADALLYDQVARFDRRTKEDYLRRNGNAGSANFFIPHIEGWRSNTPPHTFSSTECYEYYNNPTPPPFASALPVTSEIIDEHMNRKYSITGWLPTVVRLLSTPVEDRQQLRRYFKDTPMVKTDDFDVREEHAMVLGKTLDDIDLYAAVGRFYKDASPPPDLWDASRLMLADGNKKSCHGVGRDVAYVGPAHAKQASEDVHADFRIDDVDSWDPAVPAKGGAGELRFPLSSKAKKNARSTVIVPVTIEFPETREDHVLLSLQGMAGVTPRLGEMKRHHRVDAEATSRAAAPRSKTDSAARPNNGGCDTGRSDNHTPEEIAILLQKYRAIMRGGGMRREHYNDWVRVGMAMRNDDMPFELFDEFSKLNAKYDPVYTRKAWIGFTVRTNGPRLSIGSVYHYEDALNGDKNESGETRDDTIDVPPSAPAPPPGDGACDPPTHGYSDSLKRTAVVRALKREKTRQTREERIADYESRVLVVKGGCGVGRAVKAAITGMREARARKH